MKTLAIDIETYSSVDLGKTGVYKYAESPDFAITLIAFAIDDGPVELLDMRSCDGRRLRAFLDMLYDPAIRKTAYNANFERTCLAKQFGQPLPPEEWSCTMVQAAVAGLPMGLGAVGAALGLPEDQAKLKEGKTLVRYFCMPCKPTKTNGGRTRNLPEHDPEKWARFCDYCIRDVEVERTIRGMLECSLSNEEQRFWCLDQKINDTGVLVDLTLVDHAIAMDEANKARLEEAAIALTGIDNPSSVSQIKAWLEEQEGIEIESLGKKNMPDVLAQLETDKAKEFFTIRSELSKTSTKKYDAMRRAACADGRIRGMFQFYGATRTGRFAGRLVQLQNLPQNHLPDIEHARALVRAGCVDEVEMLYDNVSTTLSELIRSSLVPAPGHQFLVADYSAIEARVIAWFAGETWVLDEFCGDGKIYEAAASQMFGVPKDAIIKGRPEYDLRQKGKVATLACGYQGGVSALVSLGATRMGVPEEELPGLVSRWRKANPHIVRWWYSLNNAAVDAVAEGEALDPIGRVRFRYKNQHLYMVLPSGRSLCYREARLEPNRFGETAVTFMGMNQVTKKWEKHDMYPGKWAENAVQATARDCLREGMLALDAAGFDIQFHVHDEVVVSEPIGGRDVKEVCTILGADIPWAAGLPLRADGYATPFYRKD